MIHPKVFTGGGARFIVGLTGDGILVSPGDFVLLSIFVTTMGCGILRQGCCALNPTAGDRSEKAAMPSAPPPSPKLPNCFLVVLCFGSAACPVGAVSQELALE